METSGQTLPLNLPPDLVAEVQAMAEREHRTVPDMLRDLVEQGLIERRWQAHAEQEMQRARALGIAEDLPPMTDDYRQTIRSKIAQGLHSLREGKGADGETFFAEIQAELDALERQDR